MQVEARELQGRICLDTGRLNGWARRSAAAIRNYKTGRPIFTQRVREKWGWSVLMSFSYCEQVRVNAVSALLAAVRMQN